jgi:hypothetical protein
MNKLSDEKHFLLDTNAPLTEQQQAEIAALNAMPDDAIDFSDIAPLSEKFWQTCRKVYKQRPIGLAKGTLTVPDSFFESLPDDLINAFSGYDEQEIKK